jgi:hypothetical protein
MIILDFLLRGSQEELLWYPLNRRMSGPRSWSGRLGEETDPLPLPEIERRFFGNAVRIKFLIYGKESVSPVKGQLNGTDGNLMWKKCGVSECVSGGAICYLCGSGI